MKAIHNGPLVFESDDRWHGIANGPVVVRAGCRVDLHGIVNGDVIVEDGAEAVIHGITNGRVIERGGRAVVRGIANG